jgi:hypothetical protein
MEKNSHPGIRDNHPGSARNGAKRADYCRKIFLPVFSTGKRPNVLLRYNLFSKKKSLATGKAGEKQEREGQKDVSERNRIND